MGDTVSLVWVLQFESVKLIDGFFGICTSCFPQYLISAILLGDVHSETRSH